MKKKNFLITGGTGFIGSAITKYLIKNKYKVSVFDNNSRGKLNRLHEVANKFVFINGDIRNIKKVSAACKNKDVVIHLAYVNGTETFYKKPIEILDIAVKGIINVIESCIKNKIKELYIASSSEVYQTPFTIPTKESEMLKIPDIYNPRYSYGGGKIISELLGIHYGKKFFKKLVIFRPHNVYGSDMGNEHVIPQFINRMKKINKNKKNFNIMGTGKEIRSFIHINDFINAFSLILRKAKHLEIYNIGTEEKIRINKLALLISKLMNKKIFIKRKKIAKGSTRMRCPDITKIKKIGFVKRISLKKGLENIINNPDY
jgi:nucleoside-diphosphate-sugar epimerase|tara:strand:+ start:1700 stop:2647 length:948 start_codon:yes stop_codon:yes gene_type:complete